MDRRLSESLGDRCGQMPGRALRFSKERLQKHLGNFCCPPFSLSKMDQLPAYLLQASPRSCHSGARVVHMEWRGWSMVVTIATPAEHLRCARHRAGCHGHRGNKLMSLPPPRSGLPSLLIVFTAALEVGIMTLRHSEAGDLHKHTGGSDKCRSQPQVS